MTLDEDLRNRAEISLLKIDVQGYEPQVLKGAQAILKRTKILMIEVTYSSYYHGDMQFADLHRLVTSIAPFRLWGISAPHCAPSGKPMWADAVYVQAS
jgi:Methyltransferase FkbM domain